MMGLQRHALCLCATYHLTMLLNGVASDLWVLTDVPPDALMEVLVDAVGADVAAEMDCAAAPR